MHPFVRRVLPLRYALASAHWALNLAGCASGSHHPAGEDAGAVDAAPPDAASSGSGSDAALSDAASADGAASDAAHADAAARPSTGCGTADFTLGTSTAELAHGGLTRSYRVHLPPAYDGSTPLPLVLMFHGGGGSGRQFELNSSHMDAVADGAGFIAVYPDGTGVLRTWNGGGCCGSAVTNDVDDVGFSAALLDRLEASACVDRRRIYAAGMSNGGIFAHRLGCELADRIAAIAPVAAVDMTEHCTPARPVPIMHIHGTSDGHVPWDGGTGCGPTDVPFTPVPESIARWRMRNGCADTSTPSLDLGDGHCEATDGCRDGADVVLCAIAGGGHNWPGGEPPADLVECPGNGGQSSTFDASRVIWSFFADHAL